MPLYLGVDIGGSTVKAAAVRDGSVLWTARSRRYHRATTDQLKDAVREVSQRLEDPADGVGLCVPGLLDERHEHVTLSVNVPGLVGVPLRELVADVAGDRAPQVVNDANATGYDLYMSRNLSGRLLAIVIGTGVGAAVIDEGGKPLLVDGDSPGHIGQLDVSVEGALVIGPDGGRGSLEGYLGAPALRRRYGPDPAGKVDPRDPAARALVRAIRIAHAIYRPHHVCIAGGTGIRLARLLPELKHRIEDKLTGVARPWWTLSFGDSDFHAAAGAARIAAAGSWPRAKL
jgi:glucokinase